MPTGWNVLEWLMSTHSRCLTVKHCFSLTRFREQAQNVRVSVWTTVVTDMWYGRVSLTSGSWPSVWRSKSRWCSPLHPVLKRWYLQRSQRSDGRKAHWGDWNKHTITYGLQTDCIGLYGVVLQIFWSHLWDKQWCEQSSYANLRLQKSQNHWTTQFTQQSFLQSSVLTMLCCVHNTALQ